MHLWFQKLCIYHQKFLNGLIFSENNFINDINNDIAYKRQNKNWCLKKSPVLNIIFKLIEALIDWNSLIYMCECDYEISKFMSLCWMVSWFLAYAYFRLCIL